MASIAERTIRQDDLFDASYVIDAVLSPDGTLAAYVLSASSGRGDNEVQNLSIWLVQTNGRKKPARLTQGQGDSYHPRFSADGTALYFLSNREGVSHIFMLTLDGGEAVQLTSLPQGAGPFELSPDGRSIAFTALAAPPQASNDNQHQRIDRFWYRFDPLGGYLADFDQALFLMPLSRKGTPRIVGEPAGVILDFSFAPDGLSLALLRTGLPQHGIFQADLNLIERVREDETADGSRQRPSSAYRERTLLAGRILSSVDFGVDGGQLLCTGTHSDLARQTSLYVINPETSRTLDRTSSLDIMVGTGLQIHVPARMVSRVLAADDGWVYATVTTGGEAHVHKISLSGKKVAQPLSQGQTVSHLADRACGKLLFIRQSPNQPPALFLMQEATGEERQLTHHNQRWQKRFCWPQVQRVVTRSQRGVSVEGWVLKPVQVAPPYKTILTIHGGPHLAYGCSFWSDFHEMVGAGYAVAFMNPRGSTGYGNDFCRSILGRWGDPELKDFNAFLDHLVVQGIADPDRLGVTGISGGGHLSAWLIGHSQRFQAAVPEQGVYSMISMWGTSDAGRDLLELEMGGELHKMPMTYWERSPLAYAHKCRTPTLLLQGENDIRCPMEQAEQFFAKLHHHGCDVVLVPMKRCSHGEQVSGRPALRRFRMDALRDWFDTHID